MSRLRSTFDHINHATEFKIIHREGHEEREGRLAAWISGTANLRVSHNQRRIRTTPFTLTALGPTFNYNDLSKNNASTNAQHRRTPPTRHNTTTSFDDSQAQFRKSSQIKEIGPDDAGREIRGTSAVSWWQATNYAFSRHQGPRFLTRSIEDHRSSKINSTGKVL